MMNNATVSESMPNKARRALLPKMEQQKYLQMMIYRMRRMIKRCTALQQKDNPVLGHTMAAKKRSNL